MDLQGKNVLVAGMGKSGVAAARLLHREGARVTVSDSRSRKALGRKPFELERLEIAVEAGKHAAETFNRADLIVLSPGIPLTLAPVAGAIRRGVPVIGEMELAFAFLKTPVLAITGSNGKSTTTTLLGDILEGWGKQVFTGGNLGTPLCEFVLSGASADWIVLEVSSFQLETIRTFRPFVGVLLNITPDHLDRYRDLREYAEAKLRLFENQTPADFAVLNAEDPWTEAAGGRGRGTPVLFSRKGPVPGGTYVDEGWITSEIGGVRRRICEAAKMGIPGVHNLENALAAASAALLCGCPPELAGETLQKFAGLEHRLEFVRELQGVRYFNDSKGTNVGAVVRSLETFEGPVILIAGGRDKGGDFAPLRERIAGRVKQVVLIGEAREKMAEALAGTTEIVEARTLIEAVSRAYLTSRNGDVVLLSPACASFDMFKNFEDRGERFKDLVWKLPEIALERLDGRHPTG